MKVIYSLVLIFVFSSLFAQNKINYEKIRSKLSIEKSNSRGIYVLDSTISLITLVPGFSQNFLKNTYLYDNEGKETKAYNYSVDLFSGGTDFQLNSIDSSIYDAKGNLSFKFTKSINNGIVSNYLKHNYTYNANNKLLVELIQLWNNSTNTYEDYQRTTNLYNTKNNIIRHLTESNSGSGLANVSKDTSIYDVNDRLAENIFFNWNTTNLIWDNETKVVNFYSGSSTNVSNYDSYDWLENAWKLTEKGANTYNSDNKPSLFNLFELDTTSNQYINTYRYDYKYDSNKNTESTIVSASEDGTSFQEVIRFNYYWSELKTGIITLKESPIVVKLPNPISSNQIISCSSLRSGSDYSIKIVDINGHIKSNMKISGDFFMPNNLNDGLYFIQIFEDHELVRIIKAVKD